MVEWSVVCSPLPRKKGSSSWSHSKDGPFRVGSGATLLRAEAVSCTLPDKKVDRKYLLVFVGPLKYRQWR